MEIVIKLPDKTYHMINAGYYDYGDMNLIIQNGIPLPKGHGRIADIDKVLEEMKATRTYDIPFALGRVKPIIEADTESEEE